MKMPPEVLRLSGGSSATFAATMIFKKRSATIDYDRRKISEKFPGGKLFKTWTKNRRFSSLEMTATVEPCRPGSRPETALESLRKPII
nr:MAG TPA: hypothetical protein [Caudoviricetes sp.]